MQLVSEASGETERDGRPTAVQAARAAIREGTLEEVSSSALSVEKGHKTDSGGEKVSGPGATGELTLRRHPEGLSRATAHSPQASGVCRPRGRPLAKRLRHSVVRVYRICRAATSASRRWPSFSHHSSDLSVSRGQDREVPKVWGSHPIKKSSGPKENAQQLLGRGSKASEEKLLKEPQVVYRSENQGPEDVTQGATSWEERQGTLSTSRLVVFAEGK